MSEYKVLLPITQFVVEFEARTGRPYSPLEQFVLRFVASKQATTLPELERSIRMHRRLVVEAIVTLTQEGWLAIGDNDTLAVTDDGAIRAASRRPLRTDMVVRQDSAYVTMERFGGTVYSEGAARFAWLYKLKQTGWLTNAIQLPERVSRAIPDESAVIDLLPVRTRPAERVDRVISIQVSDRWVQAIPLRVDLEREEVRGLPVRGELFLRPAIIEYLKGRPDLVARSTPEEISALPVQQRVPRVERQRELRPIRVAPDSDVVFTDGAHASVLTSALAGAATRLAIASAYLRANVVAGLIPLLRGALERGVCVDIMWGYEAESGGLRALRELRIDALRAGLHGQLTVNGERTGSHMKMLLWDALDGSFEGCIGSHNWLSSRFDASLVSRNTTNVSLLIHDPWLLERLAHRVVGLWSQVRDDSRYPAIDRWHTVSRHLSGQAFDSRLARNVVAQGYHANDNLDPLDEIEDDEVADIEEESANHTTAAFHGGARLVLDAEHHELVQEWADTATRRLLVFSDQLGVPALRRLGALRGRSGELSDCIVAYSRLSESAIDVLEERVGALVTDVGGRTCKVPGLHAKMLISDDRVCISSYNFLSADPGERAEGAQELGVVVEDGALASWLWSRAQPLVSVKG